MWAPIRASIRPGISSTWIDVEPRDDHVTGELAAEQEERHVGADDRDRLEEAVGDPQAGAGEQVVRQRVAGEALEHAQEQQTLPIIQLSSRGLRNAPVKKTRIRCTNIAATKSIAAQWCIWRISRPPRTSKEMSSVEA